jgi:YGGT family protein
MYDPYQNDPINAQPTDLMPDLPQKSVASTPPVSETVTHNELEENLELRQDEARTLKFVIGKTGDFLRWFSIVLEVMLGIRFLLKLIGADPNNAFAAFLYALTDIILFPFNTLVQNPSLHVNQAFEITTLIGMGIYALLFWLLRSFVRILVSEPHEPVE